MSPDWLPAVMRALHTRSLPNPVQRAARLTLGVQAASLTAEERVQAAKSLLKHQKNAPDALTRGLGAISLGRILAADLREGHTGVLDDTQAARALIDGARKSPATVRGFKVLALGLSLRDLERQFGRS